MFDSSKFVIADEEEMEDFHDYEDEEHAEPHSKLDDYEDDESHWEMKPSLWIEPIGDWGDGEVLLLEIPSDSETNDNIIAQWRPKAGLAAGGSVSFAYRQFWCWTAPATSWLSAASRKGKRP